eukprot:3603471-Lingulodinium_polyedra.AAC.1
MCARSSLPLASSRLMVLLSMKRACGTGERRGTRQDKRSQEKPREAKRSQEKPREGNRRAEKRR